MMSSLCWVTVGDITLGGQVCLLGQGTESAQCFADVQLLAQSGREALPGRTGQENGN